MDAKGIRRLRRRRESAHVRVPAGEDTLGLTLSELDELVSAAGAERPDRVAEWRWYLDYLRRQSRPDGSLPREYGLLVRLVFGDLPQLADAQRSRASRSDST